MTEGLITITNKVDILTERVDANSASLMKIEASIGLYNEMDAKKWGRY